MDDIKAIFNWSGGKDSALCLYESLMNEHVSVISLVTTINQQKGRISMHGVRASLLEKQSHSLNLPLLKVFLNEMPTMDDYNQQMREMLLQFKKAGVTHSIFGDIFLEDLKKYRDEKLSEVGMYGYYPLWKRDSKEVIESFIKRGFKSMLVCVNAAYLDESFLGRELDQSLINDLPENVDVCGENGEYHTFVYDGPIFKYPISFEKGEKVFKNYTKQKKSNQDIDYGFWYLDLIDK